MLKATEVIRRLKQMLDYKNDLQLAQVLEIKPNTLSTWKKRESLDYNKIMEVCRNHKIDLNTLFLAESNSSLTKNMETRRVKMIAVDQHLAYFLNPEKCYGTAPASVFPLEEDINIAFQIGIENMYPTIKVSSYVLAQKTKIEEMQLWQIYLLVVEGRGIICYRFKERNAKGNLLLQSDNDVFGQLELNPSEIREVYSVRGAFMPAIKNLIGN